MGGEEGVDARLSDFLASPTEALDREYKGWLDLADKAVAATLARHLIALANHGGGWLIFGLREQAGELHHEGKPCPDPKAYSQDALNSIVARYASPAFQCQLHKRICGGCGGEHAFIRVPGGHRIPITCKRSGPDPDNDPRKGLVYDRLAGPQSAPVLEPDDWHTLLERCLGERQDVLVENVKSAIEVLGRQGLAEALAVGAGDGSAAIGAASPQQHDFVLLRSFAEASRKRLDQRIAESGKDPYPDGSWSFAYAVEPAPEPPVPLPALRQLMHEVVGRETGWPAWWWPSGDGAPQVKGETIECWMTGGYLDDPAHSDFWRASEDGRLYLLRGYDEDAAQALSPAHSNLEPGSILDPGIVVWRIGECLLHAERMARELKANAVRVLVHWSGLAGRQISTLEPMRRIFTSGPSSQAEVTSSLVIDANVISSTLAEQVANLTRPLFTSFDFFEMPLDTIESELERMRGRSLG